MADQDKGAPRDPGGEAGKTQPDSYRDFLDALQWPANLAPGARPAAEAVLCALARHLSDEQLQESFEQLPKRLQELLLRCPRHQRPEDKHAAGRAFVDDVASHLGLSPDDVEPVVRLVFEEIRDRLSEDENEEVAAQLPEELAEHWRRLS